MPFMSWSEPENMITKGMSINAPKSRTIASRIHFVPFASIIGHREYCTHLAFVNGAHNA